MLSRGLSNKSLSCKGAGIPQHGGERDIGKSPEISPFLQFLIGASHVLNQTRSQTSRLPWVECMTSASEVEGRVESGQGRGSQIRPGALPFPRCRSSVTGHRAHPTVLGAGLGGVNSSSHPSPSLAPFHSLVFTKDKRGRQFT